MGPRQEDPSPYLQQDYQTHFNLRRTNLVPYKQQDQNQQTPNNPKQGPQNHRKLHPKKRHPTPALRVPGATKLRPSVYAKRTLLC